MSIVLPYMRDSAKQVDAKQNDGRRPPWVAPLSSLIFSGHIFLWFGGWLGTRPVIVSEMTEVAPGPVEAAVGVRLLPLPYSGEPSPTTGGRRTGANRPSGGTGGPGCPVVVIGEGALAALQEVWQQSWRQRCGNHGVLNALDKSPKGVWAQARQSLRVAGT